MDVKGEANAVKIELAKNLEKLSENAEVVIGKKTENNTAEIKIEDKSKHLTVNLNFYLIGSVPSGQVEAIAQRVKEVMKGQAEFIKASGDEVFEPYVTEKIGLNVATAGTANAVLIQNSDYILKGKPKPVFITPPGVLPMSVTVIQPKIKIDKT